MTLLPDAPDAFPRDATVFADLTPEAVLNALASAGLNPDGRLMALNSYENRVFQVGLDDERLVVAKFYRPGRWTDAQILEEHAFAEQLREADIPVVAPLTLHTHAGPTTLAHWTSPDSVDHGNATPSHYRFSISPRKGGRAPELDDPDTLRWLGRLMARMHAVGRQAPFTHRLTLSTQTWGRASRQFIAEHGLLPQPQDQAWLAATDQALDLVDACLARVPDVRTGRIHGDCHIGNMLWTPDGPHFVDLDDACNGPAVQDLWMLLGGLRQDRQAALHALMDGYETLEDFDWREWPLMEALRTLRLIHHSAWLAKRWHDPAFPAAFPWFGSAMYWQQQTDQLRQQIELMQQEVSSQ